MEQSHGERREQDKLYHRDSHLRLPNAKDFLWACGIEDTFVATPHRRTGRILDEYALTEHYERWEEDLSLLADLGIEVARYGIPWHRVCTAKGCYDWSWTDKVLERLVLHHGIEPIIDLVHYGTPLWMTNSFLCPDYPKYVAEYAHAFAEHYRGLCYWYTPLNEPRINAWYCGRIGWWPPFGKSWKTFSQVMIQLCRGICLTQQAISAVEPESIFVHVDASDFFVPMDRNDAAVVEEAEFRQNLVFLALDLVTGRVDATHALTPWLTRHGIDEQELRWFGEERVTPHVVGFNMYPMFSRKEVRRERSGGIGIRITPCWTETLEEIARQYAARYSPIPVMLTEAAARGRMTKRIQWIEDSARLVASLRKEGMPLVGYVFWPLFSLVTWAYQSGTREVDQFLVHMGLYDLTRGPNGLERVATPAVASFKDVVHSQWRADSPFILRDIPLTSNG